MCNISLSVFTVDVFRTVILESAESANVIEELKAVALLYKPSVEVVSEYRVSFLRSSAIAVICEGCTSY